MFRDAIVIAFLALCQFPVTGNQRNYEVAFARARARKTLC